MTAPSPLVTGEGPDPDRDGLVNLMEHGFGADPKVADGQSVGIANPPGAGADPSISFSWSPLAGYSYGLEMSTTLNGDFVDRDAPIVHQEMKDR